MLELKMRGYPRPNIKWSKDGQPISAGDRHKFVYPDAESVALIISKVSGEDVGTYKVTLSNDLGETSTEGKLQLSGAPQFQVRQLVFFSPFYISKAVILTLILLVPLEREKIIRKHDPAY